MMKTRLLNWAAKLRSEPLVLAVLFCAVLAPLLVFGKLADEVHEGEKLFFDEPILRFIHQHATSSRDPLMVFVTNLGRAPVVVPFSVAVIVFLLMRKQPDAAKFYGLAVGGAALLNLAAKQVFGRARPSLWASIAPEYDFGFPSGHAMVSMAIAAALIAIAWPTKGRWPMIVAGIAFTASVGFTRMYLGVHYPSDVLAGWCASLAWVTGLYFLMKRRLR